MSEERKATSRSVSKFLLSNFSLRCQSHIYLKLYKICRHEIKELQRIISDYKPNMTEMTNGNTPSPLSPTSVGSQVRIAKIFVDRTPFDLFRMIYRWVWAWNAKSSISLASHRAPVIVLANKIQSIRLVTWCRYRWVLTKGRKAANSTDPLFIFRPSRFTKRINDKECSSTTW